MKIKAKIWSLMLTVITINFAMANYEFCSDIAPQTLNEKEVTDMPWELTENEKADIRNQIIKAHLNFLANKEPKGWGQILSNTWFCSSVSNTWRSIEEFFPKDFTMAVVPDSIKEMQNDYKFQIELYNTGHFSKYKYEKQIELFIGGGDPTDIILQKDRDFDEKSKGPLVVDRLGSKFICPPKTHLTDSNMEFYLYIFYEETINVRGVIAIAPDCEKFLFVGGPFLPLRNFSTKISEFSHPDFQDFQSFDVSHLPYNYGIHYMYVEMVREGKIPEDFYIRNMNGLGVYANAIGKVFLPLMIIDNLFLGVDFKKYESGYFYFSLFGKNLSRESCKYKGYDQSSSNAKKSNSIRYISGLPCNNYEGNVVTELHIRINPEKGDVEFKIADTKNLGNVPECSEKY